MNKITLFSIQLLLLALITQLGMSQSTEGYYMHIDYINVEKNDIPEFENHISNILKPVQESRISDDVIAEWYVYKVAYPGTQDPSYNYVFVSLSDDLEDFDDSNEQIIDRMSELTGSDETNEFQKWLIPYRSELWRINNSVLTENDSRASKYFVMDYMDVQLGMEYTYQMMEDEVALPIHRHRMDIDQMNGWELFSLIVPGGTEYGYNFATGNYFSDLRHFEFGFTEEIIRQSHPDTDINEINETFAETRDLVRSEVWELIDHVR
ncbi:MAG: hypothetical protein RI575_02395 [Balneolaceae bacterium]|nr:hypothetical protein [Balneolaceae bacterium]MDR9409269.1 hypothetical protein [Balneolaceae bacterium]